MEALEHTDTFIMTHQKGKICHKSPKYIILQRTAGVSVPLFFTFMSDKFLIHFTDELVKGLPPLRQAKLLAEIDRLAGSYPQ